GARGGGGSPGPGSTRGEAPPPKRDSKPRREDSASGDDGRECSRRRGRGGTTLDAVVGSAAPWPWPRTRRRRRRLSRVAYRMAILSSLAYHDFRDGRGSIDDDDGGANSTRRWEFALADDAPPARYLLESPEGSGGRARSPKRFLLGYDDPDGGEAAAPSRRREKISFGRAWLGIRARFRVSLCRARHSARGRLAKSHTHNATETTEHCKRTVLRKHEAGKRYRVEWAFNNWHEESSAKIRWHDTDLIVATSGSSEVVLAFAGTASAADAVTNVQTLEPASHSGLFGEMAGADPTNNETVVQGGIHRGFLNAYARVGRGKIRKVSAEGGSGGPFTEGSLDEYFRDCLVEQVRPKKASTAVATIPRQSGSAQTKSGIQHLWRDALRDRRERRDAKRRRNRVCHSEGRRLMDILRDVTAASLLAGRTVHLTGHSMAGSLATLHALDVVLNRPDVPVDNLRLWTFGAPEIADSLFFESAGARSRRAREFFGDDARVRRYVTHSHRNCGTDPVASVTSWSLNRPAMRWIGGVRGDVVHAIEPTFVGSNVTGGELHEIKSYLGAISSSVAPDARLNTDFPPRLRRWLGESLRQGVEE
ncbi:hypothetical protein ACHAWF_011028, partial [Thalassiosira exigua]